MLQSLPVAFTVECYICIHSIFTDSTPTLLALSIHVKNPWLLIRQSEWIINSNNVWLLVSGNVQWLDYFLWC